MYDLYFSDEQSMPCVKQRRFRNFNKKSQIISKIVHEPVEKAAPVPVLPMNIIAELESNDVTETAFAFIKSSHSSRSGKGTAFAIAFDEFMVLMWRDEGMPFSVLKLEQNEIKDFLAEEDEVNEDLITLSVATETKLISLWFDLSQAEEVVNFINAWKIRTVHGTSDIEAPTPEVERAETASETVGVPDIKGVAQEDLPKTILFGTLLLDQMADGSNITEQDLELLNQAIGNPDLLNLCISNFKQADKAVVIQVVKDTFNDDQKLMLLANMADLAYRNGEPHPSELSDLHDLVTQIGMCEGEVHNLLNIFKVKNDTDILA